MKQFFLSFACTFSFFCVLLTAFSTGCGVFLVGQASDFADAGEEAGESEAGFKLQQLDAGSVDSDADVSAESSADSDADASVEVDSSCPLHDNGVGGQYASCHPQGAHNQTTANSACQSFIKGTPGAYCVTNPVLSCRGQDGTIVGSANGPEGFDGLWDFGGAAAGHVVKVPSDGGVACPAATDPVWN